MLNRNVAKIVFYIVAIILFVWTGSLTVSFVQTVLPNAFWLMPFLVLVVFDGGLLAWMIVFLSHAQGGIQRAVALLLTVFNLLGVGLMVISEILLGGQTLIAAPESLSTVAVWSIGIWTIVNVAGVVIFHLGDNEARKEMAIQSEKDAIFDGALRELGKLRADNQARLAGELSQTMFAKLTADINADQNRNGVSDIMERGRQDGPRTVPSDRIALPDGMTPEELTAAIALAQQSKNTYTARPDSDKPNGPPAKGGGANF